MGRQGTERSTRAVRLDAQLTNWECSPVKEQQVSTSEINTRRHRRELPKAAPRSKDRTFRRSRLIDAARGLFHEKGFAATTIDDIIERIGGSRGTLYIYFGSKLELFETIVREEADRFSKTLDDAFAMGADDKIGRAPCRERVCQYV